MCFGMDSFVIKKNANVLLHLFRLLENHRVNGIGPRDETCYISETSCLEVHDNAEPDSCQTHLKFVRSVAADILVPDFEFVRQNMFKFFFSI